MANRNLHLTDDGTLDTVVACSACGWEGRYNPEEIVGGYTDGDVSERGLAMRRTENVLAMAEEDHDCEDSA